MKRILLKAILLMSFPLLVVHTAHATRIKDMADIKGVRQNQLIGYGLVIGLDGTGDGKKAKFTIHAMASMLEKMGITIKPEDIDVDNVAAVIVTTDLPAFARVGSRVDALVSSIGDAKNLQGGTLLFTPMKAANGKIYAVAQGPVSTGGFSAGGAGGMVQKNFPTVGRVVGGALIEREIEYNFSQKENLTLSLHTPDFTTAFRVSEAINTALLDRFAEAPDPGTIRVEIPEKYRGNIVELVTLIEGLHITPDQAAKVVINERTGTVVMGENVRISTIAIAHGNLSVEIKETPGVSQPLPFSKGQTVVTPDTNVSIKEGDSRLFLMEPGVNIGELVRALNALGVSPRDLIAIFQAIKSAGALQAKLKII